MEAGPSQTPCLGWDEVVKDKLATENSHTLTNCGRGTQQTKPNQRHIWATVVILLLNLKLIRANNK